MLPLLKHAIYTTDKHIIFNIFNLKLKFKKKDYYLQKELERQREIIQNNLKITELKPATGELREIQLACIEILKKVKKI